MLAQRELVRARLGFRSSGIRVRDAGLTHECSSRPRGSASNSDAGVLRGVSQQPALPRRPTRSGMEQQQVPALPFRPGATPAAGALFRRRGGGALFMPRPEREHGREGPGPIRSNLEGQGQTQVVYVFCQTKIRKKFVKSRKGGEIPCFKTIHTLSAIFERLTNSMSKK